MSAVAAVPYHAARCYACDGQACGIRDRRPEGGMAEAACKRHADPTIAAFAACCFCLGARPTIVIGGLDLAHKRCHSEAAA
jgi:hypothetical protein